MHDTAMDNGGRFFDTYCLDRQVTIVDIGAQDVNGSLRKVAPPDSKYIGVDFVEGDGVDIVLQDPYSFPIESEYADIVVSSSCFEHSEMFWLTFKECLRILKPHGLLYINAPSNGIPHYYPVDCWRFYPDAGQALVKWGMHCGYNPALLESYISQRIADIWEDFVAVICKDECSAGAYKDRRIIDNHPYLVLGTERSMANWPGRALTEIGDLDYDEA